MFLILLSDRDLIFALFLSIFFFVMHLKVYFFIFLIFHFQEFQDVLIKKSVRVKIHTSLLCVPLKTYLLATILWDYVSING